MSVRNEAPDAHSLKTPKRRRFETVKKTIKGSSAIEQRGEKPFSTRCKRPPEKSGGRFGAADSPPVTGQVLWDCPFGRDVLEARAEAKIEDPFFNKNLTDTESKIC